MRGLCGIVLKDRVGKIKGGVYKGKNYINDNFLNINDVFKIKYEENLELFYFLDIM